MGSHFDVTSSKGNITKAGVRFYEIEKYVI